MLYDDLVADLEAINVDFEADGAEPLTWTKHEVIDSSPYDTVLDIDPFDADTIAPPGTHLHITTSLGSLTSESSRWFSAINQAAAESAIGVPVIYIFMDFVADPTYANLSNVTFNWDGHDWMGVGDVGGIEFPDESSDLTAQPVKLTLSGVKTEFITHAQAATYKNQKVIIYVGMHHPQTLALLDEPEEFWRGFMDVMTISADKGKCNIELLCEHWLRIGPSATRQTDEEQVRLHPPDRWYQWLHTVRDPGKWGSKDTFYGGGGSYSGGGGGRFSGNRNYV